MENIKERLIHLSIRNIKEEDKQVIYELLEILISNNFSISKCNQILDKTKKVLPHITILK